MTHYIPATETAKDIRKVLKANFPGVKFSVRCSSGSAINIHWVDGPTTKQVDALVGHMKAGNFNGMIDLYEYTPGNNLLNKYVFTNRHYTPDFLQQAAEKFNVDNGYHYLPEINVSDYDGHAWLTDSKEYIEGAQSRDYYYSFSQQTMRIAQEMAQ